MPRHQTDAAECKKACTRAHKMVQDAIMDILEKLKKDHDSETIIQENFVKEMNELHTIFHGVDLRVVLKKMVEMRSSVDAFAQKHISYVLHHPDVSFNMLDTVVDIRVLPPKPKTRYTSWTPDTFREDYLQGLQESCGGLTSKYGMTLVRREVRTQSTSDGGSLLPSSPQFKSTDSVTKLHERTLREREPIVSPSLNSTTLSSSQTSSLHRSAFTEVTSASLCPSRHLPDSGSLSEDDWLTQRGPCEKAVGSTWTSLNSTTLSSSQTSSLHNTFFTEATAASRCSSRLDSDSLSETNEAINEHLSLDKLKQLWSAMRRLVSEVSEEESTFQTAGCEHCRKAHHGCRGGV